MPRGGGPGGGNAPRHGQHGFQPKDAPLTEPEHRQIARWLGEFIAPMRIAELVWQTFQKRIDPQYGYSFQKRQKWAGLIDRYRQEWLVQVAEVPLAHKKYRLERLMALVEQLDGQARREAIAPERYERRLLTLLDRARLEMEERKDTQTWFVTNVQLNQCSDAELVQRRTALLKRIQAFRLPIRRLTDAQRVGDGQQIVETTGSDDPADDGGDPAVGHDPDHKAGEGPVAR